DVSDSKEADQKKKIAIPLVTTGELVDEEEEKNKRVGFKKTIKKKTNNLLEVDGIGVVSSLTQLNRISYIDRVERVFRPSKVGRRKKIVSKKGIKKPTLTLAKQIKRVVEIKGSISVGDLARGMDIKSSQVIKRLMDMGTMTTVNQVLDHDTAALIAREFKYEVKDVSFNEGRILEGLDKGVQRELEHRPPVVTVMGHVDHGKTSLLDAIREANVTAGEFGGITQHIGAYTVTLPKGTVTFLDTPGHEAFTAMRARGASLTDIVILVVAADDGIMPQTIESIDHAKAAGVPIVVAINKIDKPEADIDRVKRQLSDRGLMPEEWGGETLYALVSALKKQGIQDLLDAILLQAEILELQADRRVLARGIVIEALLDRQRGPVATILVQEGTLKTGDLLIAGCCYGRVRAMRDHLGQVVDFVPPSYAVEIMG
ncbi:translation initiation factor IF-2, partial [Candidatus Magnetobacterium casense]